MNNSLATLILPIVFLLSQASFVWAQDAAENADEKMPKIERRTEPVQIDDLLKDEETPEEVDNEPTPMVKRKKETIDAQSHSGSRFIEHPNAKKGLIRIDKDKVYHYKVTPSEQNKAASVRIGTYEPTDLVNPENTDVSYDLIYDDDSTPMITYDYQRQFFQKFGKLAWKFGTGIFIAQGTGQFVTPQAEEPKEEFTLFVFPLNIGVTYRAQFWDSQFIVPYGEASAGGFAFAEYRDDDQNPSLGAALGFAPMAQFTAGGSIQMGSGPRSFLDLDREYGINTFWIDVEYRTYLALGDYDFSGEVISVGFTAEY